MTTLQQAGMRGRSVVNLANGTGVVLAGLDIPLQQQDHNGLGQVAGGASLSHWWCVVKCVHVILAGTRISRLNKKVLIKV